MKSLRAAAAALALTASLTGLSGAAHADPGDGVGPFPYPSGPTCYGGVYSYHVWNLFHPMDVYGVDSCAITLMITYRRAGGTFAQYVSALSAARWPQVGVPLTTLVFLWNASTDAMAVCAAPGRGVELTVSDLWGQVIACRTQ